MTHAPLSLVPQITLAPNSTINLGFTATLNNDVLGLVVGKRIRAEVLVTFGNAGDQWQSASNVDINGSGSVGVDEVKVRTVLARLGQKLVPAPIVVNSPAVVAGTLADITTTGTVSFSNPVFSLGTTSGTVRVNYDAGVSGGTIRNCAHLTCTGISLDGCDTESIAAESFAWTDGDLITYSGNQWGDIPNGMNAASLLVANFAAVYPSGQIELGVPGPTGYSILFTDAHFILSHLPAGGPNGALVMDELNPTSTFAGTFGSWVFALQLNVNFSDAAIGAGASGLRLGDLRLRNIPNLPLLDGMSVRQVLTLVNTLLGGGTGIYAINDLDGLIADLSTAFSGGIPSAFAQAHLRL